MSKVLTPEWREWIQTNLARNCTIQSMVDAMVAKEIDAVSAATFIARVSREVNNKSPSPLAGGKKVAGYEYEASRLISANQITLANRKVTVRMRLARPEIVVVDKLLSDNECNELVCRSQAKVKPLDHRRSRDW